MASCVPLSALLQLRCGGSASLPPPPRPPALVCAVGGSWAPCRGGIRLPLGQWFSMTQASTAGLSSNAASKGRGKGPVDTSRVFHPVCWWLEHGSLQHHGARPSFATHLSGLRTHTLLGSSSPRHCMLRRNL